ncbi:MULTISPECIES: hypothetical protein [unclassified Pseudomonas]|uniref:hypothetical protein n=1 Tax=unclassified Pseudomonas TaxID=196821 RepID=UPI001AE2A7A7|nr:hypothetical protein [Pseudomonas sp. BP8]MBP2263541.1 hypothetical protein [Pseudomonas sp. BP8]HDS1735206.1 hypothetical protein [Pseudomonas putida]
MTIDTILKTLGLRHKSLAERINDKVMSGYIPSDMAKAIVGKLSSKKINDFMIEARDKYNRENENKVFKDE